MVSSPRGVPKAGAWQGTHRLVVSLKQERGTHRLVVSLKQERENHRLVVSLKQERRLIASLLQKEQKVPINIASLLPKEQEERYTPVHTAGAGGTVYSPYTQQEQRGAPTNGPGRPT